MRHGKVFAQMKIHGLDGRLGIARGDHRQRQAVQLFADHVILLAELDQLAQFVFQLFAFFAQRQDLPLAD